MIKLLNISNCFPFSCIPNLIKSLMNFWPAKPGGWCKTKSTALKKRSLTFPDVTKNIHEILKIELGIPQPDELTLVYCEVHSLDDRFRLATIYNQTRVNIFLFKILLTLLNSSKHPCLANFAYTWSSSFSSLHFA